MKNKLHFGISGDAFFLMLVKLVTIALGLVTTRLLSEYLTVYDYGTYSEILLIVSTVSSVTILGMMDGVNYFYCSEQNENRREEYISTIFALQCAVSAAAGCAVMVMSGPLCEYFENPDIKGLIVFAAALPLLQNLLSMVQILLVSVGKARMLAARNFIVSVIRLAVVMAVVFFIRNVAVILATTVILDAVQIALFGSIIGKKGCRIHIRSIRPELIRNILYYCVPMALFVMVNALNRDIDKYIIAMFTDTETLAVYTNASKMLPFDIITTSFCTVLIPQITKFIAQDRKEKAAKLYKTFTEISFVSTGILCCAALSAAPQLMKLLYSDKYMSGLAVFSIYIVVDLFRFTNITLVLSAAGRTKKLMLIGFAALAVNTVLNIVLFRFMGIVGPAVSTLATTIGTGAIMLYLSAKELGTRIKDFFDMRYVSVFAAESVIGTALMFGAQRWLEGKGVHYFIILVTVCGAYCLVMAVLNGKRLLKALKSVNSIAE